MTAKQTPQAPDLFPLMTSNSLKSPDPLALNLQIGLMVTSTVATAVKLHLAEQIADEPKTVDELASLTQSHAPTLLLLLNALASIGIFVELDTETHTFGNTERSRLLLSDTTGGLIQLWSAGYQWDSWRDLIYTVQTGKPAVAKTYGEDANIWSYLNQHEDESKVFQQGLAVHSLYTVPAVLDAYDFSLFRRVIDVGGGHGALSLSLLRQYPTLHVTLFDRDNIIDMVQQNILPSVSEDITERLALATGSFFEEVPQGDCAIIKSVLMDWGDDDYVSILRCCRKAIGSSGRLLIVEPVLGAETSFTRFFSLQMAVMMHAARHRTLVEHEALFASAGFTLVRAIPLGLEQMLLEGYVSPAKEEVE